VVDKVLSMPIETKNRSHRSHYAKVGQRGTPSKNQAIRWAGLGLLAILLLFLFIFLFGSESAPTKRPLTRVSTQFIEGWTFKQMRAKLDSSPDLKHDTKELTDAQIMEKLGRPGVHPEGQFFPDTYITDKGVSDLEVLKLSMAFMNKRLREAWEARAEGISISSPEEALILASIIEKETGSAQDRGLVSGVFHNRLKIGMRLQTDPTVIYGLGDRFDGNLRKTDLQTDTPYNTYTRAGLPPTPIAAPSLASLKAATAPEKTDALYFVAKGDGSGASYFSRTLDEHNRAVQRYLATIRKTQ
jgi:UPF0755 protein